MEQLKAQRGVARRAVTRLAGAVEEILAQHPINTQLLQQTPTTGIPCEVRQIVILYLEMEQLKAQRGVARRAVTRLAGAVEEILAQHPINTPLLQVKMQLLAENITTLDRVYTNISTLMTEINATEAELNEEHEATESYKERFLLLQSRLHSVMSAPAVPDSVQVGGEETQAGRKRNFRLPTIDFVKFDGDLRNWIRFWGQFKKIHEDTTLDGDDKFQMLLQATTSKARQLVETYLPSAENYGKAMNHLKSRYAKDECLIEVYIRELLSLVTNQVTAKSKIPLETLVDKLQTQLGALDSLGVTKEKYAAMLLPLVESALPQETLKAWGRYRSTPREDSGEGERRQDATVGLEKLMQFLTNEVETEERIRLAYAPFHSVRTPGPAEPSKSAKEATPTAASLFSVGEPGKPLCVFCEKPHLSQECFKAQDLSLEEKGEIIKKKKCCCLCLRPHGKKPCKVFLRCMVCRKRHYTIMCPEVHTSEPEADPSDPNQNALANIPTVKPAVLLKTLLVKARGQRREKIVRIFLDDGSQKSYISKDCIKELNPKKVGTQWFRQSTFGGLDSLPKKHNLYTLELANLATIGSTEIQIFDQDCITNYVPRPVTAHQVPELEGKGITISDIGPRPPHIDILLGADLIPSVVTGRIEKVNEHLLAIETIFGWTLMGRVSLNSNQSSTQVCLSSFSAPGLPKLKTLKTKEPCDAADRGMDKRTRLANMSFHCADITPKVGKNLQMDKDCHKKISQPKEENLVHTRKKTKHSRLFSKGAGNSSHPPPLCLLGDAKGVAAARNTALRTAPSQALTRRQALDSIHTCSWSGGGC